MGANNFEFKSNLIDDRAIRKESPNLAWLFDGEYDDYIYSRIAEIKKEGFEAYQEVAKNLFNLFEQSLSELIQGDNLSLIGIPERAHRLIKYCFENDHGHFLGRFDFAGGLYTDQIKLLEFNSDTPTLLCETGQLQHGLQEGTEAFDLLKDIVDRVKMLMDQNDLKTVLITSLGHPEDRKNAMSLVDRLKKINIEAQYLNLEDIIFSKGEGVFGEFGPDFFIQFDLLIKWVPWEFILFDEPELFDLLEEMIMNKQVVVINPITSWVYQNKKFLSYLYQHNPDHPNLLATYNDPNQLSGKKYVKKPCFGRLGENISIHDDGRVIAETEGDFGHFDSVYQEFFSLDKYFSIYLQPSIYYTDKPSVFNLRAQEDLIIDDDCYFVVTMLKD